MHPFLNAMRGRAVLAPMAGITDRVFRSLCRECGCPFAVTEMVSAKGYTLAPSPDYGRGLLDAAPGELLAAQLFGSDPQVIAQATALISSGPFCAIDINMGCPAPKITSGGEGGALMKTPALAEQIARAAVGASRVPVTAKMRLGWDEHSRNYIDFALRLQDAGVSAIAVHGRTRAQMYAGSADWDAIARVVQALSIPVIANGDVRDADSFAALLAHTRAHAVMIGRGALGNPFVFEQIHAHIAQKPSPAATIARRIQTAKRHAGMLCAYKGERAAIPEMRKHAAWYIAGMPGGAQIRRRIHAATSLDQLFSILDEGVDGGATRASGGPLS